MFAKRWVHAKKQEHFGLSWDAPYMPITHSQSGQDQRDFPTASSKSRAPRPMGWWISQEKLTEERSCFRAQKRRVGSSPKSSEPLVKYIPNYKNNYTLVLKCQALYILLVLVHWIFITALGGESTTWEFDELAPGGRHVWIMSENAHPAHKLSILTALSYLWAIQPILLLECNPLLRKHGRWLTSHFPNLPKMAAKE